MVARGAMVGGMNTRVVEVQGCVVEVQWWVV